MDSYFEKLQDPRWQKKRLEIFQRDNWTCTMCGATDKTLTVHHGYYERGLEPWEHPEETLWTVCFEPCHAAAQHEWLGIKYLLGLINPKYYRQARPIIEAIRVPTEEEVYAVTTILDFGVIIEKQEDQATRSRCR